MTDNDAIARVFGEIADLLEIRGDNAFKVRAYRSAAEVVAGWPDAVARLDRAALRELPGIGKDLAARIKELADTGACQLHDELLGQFPRTLLELLRLQGVGPKTVGRLHALLGIRSIEDLAEAARDGRLRAVKGMGARRAALLLEAIEKRERSEGRHTLAATAAVAAGLVEHLRERAPHADYLPVGSLRRGCDTCGDIDILAVGGDRSVVDAFAAHPGVTRVLGHGETKASVILGGGYQADLRVVPPASRGAAMQYFTGSKAHNIALRDRALARGLKLNEYGLFRLADDGRVAGDSEEGIYQALGLEWIEPELREHRGELDAAQHGALPQLVVRSDLRGDLHMHTTATDGRDSLEAMAAAAARLGHRYIAVTDHSKALAMANGLDERTVLEQAARIRALNGRFEHLTLLAGVECDILVDGRLDLSLDCLAQLDIVVASVHSHFSQDEARMTDRVLRALECPWVDVLGHPTGRLLLQRAPLRLDVARVIEAAARLGVALEINCLPDRLDLDDGYARLARERGVRLAISSDAHAAAALENLRWGVQVARRAWATPADVLNALEPGQLRTSLRRHAR
jgi:DNA polymerase (family 10)